MFNKITIHLENYICSCKDNILDWHFSHNNNLIIQCSKCFVKYEFQYNDIVADIDYKYNFYKEPPKENKVSKKNLGGNVIILSDYRKNGK